MVLPTCTLRQFSIAKLSLVGPEVIMNLLSFRHKCDKLWRSDATCLLHQVTHLQQRSLLL